jgi:hypothetical protein
VTIVKDSNDFFSSITFPLATIEEHGISEHSGKGQYYCGDELTYA